VHINGAPRLELRIERGGWAATRLVPARCGDRRGLHIALEPREGEPLLHAIALLHHAARRP